MWYLRCTKHTSTSIQRNISSQLKEAYEGHSLVVEWRNLLEVAISAGFSRPNDGQPLLHLSGPLFPWHQTAFYSYLVWYLHPLNPWADRINWYLHASFDTGLRTEWMKRAK